jgi:hypothetical protein
MLLELVPLLMVVLDWWCVWWSNTAVLSNKKNHPMSRL